MILGVGIDLVEHERFARSVERFGDRFLARIFSERELAEGRERQRNLQGWAARFAAKEAVFKALGFPGFMAWRQIELLSGDRAFPHVELGPHYAAHVDRHQPWKIHLSISHARASSTAVAIWETLAPSGER
ncbi:MAG TPA: holo-ACP synthase [Candidatus Ozemobacteraceae bacterium]|nr:holo-ACP synthase [Candidatus Ozemobacteraceae bacterium]HQG27422.1 holo-ACP synthase [Candidatus Ozemobacteraceae bacterium]